MPDHWFYHRSSSPTHVNLQGGHDARTKRHNDQIH